MSRVVGTERLRAAAPRWSLAGDRDLLDALQALHQGVVSRCGETGSRLEQMTDALHAASLALHDVNNRFMALSNSQFVESRVFDDEIDNTPQPHTQHVTQSSKPGAGAEWDLEKLKQSVKVLDSLHEAVTILRDSDSDSDSDGDGDIARLVLKPRDMYRDRPLPHVIGSSAWRASKHAGLIVEDSDDGDSDSAISRDSRHSRESRESRVSDESRDSPDSRRDRPPPPASSHLHTPTPAARNTEAPRAPLVYRPPAPPAPPGALFRDSPPPLPAGSPSTSSEDEGSGDEAGGDIFADLRRPAPPGPRPAPRPASPQQDDDIFSDLIDKKPVGGVPVFGAALRRDTQTHTQGNKKQTDTLEELFVKSDKKQNTDQSEEPVTEERKKTIGNRVDTDKQLQKDLLEDLFVKIDKKQKTVKPQKVVAVEKEKTIEKRVDLFSDNLFDDIDDIFTSNIVTKVPVKEVSKGEKLKSSLFDDDDDLFADIATSEANLNTKDSKTTRDAKTPDKIESIFEEDDLFEVMPSEKPSLTPNKITMYTESSQDDRNNKDIKYRKNSIEKTESTEHNKKDSIFDDEFATEELPYIPQVKPTEDLFKRENTKQIIKNSSGLFDDDSDELFGEITDVKQLHKTKESKNKEAKIIKEPDNSISNNNSEINKQIESVSDSKDDVLFNISNVKGFKPPKEKIAEKKIQSSEEKYVAAESETDSCKNVQVYKDTEFLEDDDELFKSAKEETYIFSLKSKESIEEKVKPKPTVGSFFDDNSGIDHYKVTTATEDKDCEEFADTEKKAVTTIGDLNTQEKVIESQNISIEDGRFKNDSRIDTISEKAIEENGKRKMYEKPGQDFKSDVANETGTKGISNITGAKAQNTTSVTTVIDNISEDYKTTNENEGISTFNDTSLETSDKTHKDDARENISDIMFEPPSTDNDIFSDVFDVEPPVFDDLPPVFKKSKEPKKSKNVNALFDDDSDDEALFFKKNDPVLDEKPEDFSSKTNTDLFGIFDEPPAIDVDFIQKPSKIDISKTDVKLDEATEPNEKSVETDVFVDRLIVKDKGSVEDIFKDVTTIKHEISMDVGSDENLFKPKLKYHEEEKPELIKAHSPEAIPDIVDNTDGAYQNVERKKVGKLKPMNFNINVNTLLPGASPKKQRTYEQTDNAVSTKSNEELHTSALPLNDNEFESKLVKSVSFEGDPESSVLDNKFSKERPKIQVKRRPSTRRARREAVKKSGVDFGEDSTDNYSSVDDPPKAATADNVDNPVEMENETMTSQNDALATKVDGEKSLGKYKVKDNIFTESKTSDLLTESSDALTDQSAGGSSNDVFKSANLFDDGSVAKPLEVKSKVVYILNDEDIFTNTTPDQSVTLKPEEKLEPSKSKTLDVDDDIFSNIKTATNIESQVNVETEVKTLGQLYNENKQTEHNLDDDIFKDFAKAGTKIETKRNLSEKRIDTARKKEDAKSKKSLFDDLSDEENELFNTKRNVVTKKSTVFDSDDEELFRKSAKGTTEKKETSTEKKEIATEKKIMKKVEVKASLFGDDDDDDDLFNPKRKEQSETKSAGGDFRDPLAPSDDQ